MDEKEQEDSTLVDRQSSQRIYRLIQRKDFALRYGGGSVGKTFINYGVVSKITPSGKYTVLHVFCSLTSCADGGEPADVLAEGRHCCAIKSVPRTPRPTHKPAHPFCMAAGAYSHGIRSARFPCFTELACGEAGHIWAYFCQSRCLCFCRFVPFYPQDKVAGALTLAKQNAPDSLRVAGR